MRFAAPLACGMLAFTAHGGAVAGEVPRSPALLRWQICTNSAIDRIFTEDAAGNAYTPDEDLIRQAFLSCEQDEAALRSELSDKQLKKARRLQAKSLVHSISSYQTAEIAKDI